MPRRFLSLLLTSAALALAPAVFAVDASTPPNVIVILADDMGYNDFSC